MIEDAASGALALAMVASFVLIVAGVKLALDPESRRRGLLMVAAAVVLIMNVMIVTV